MSPYSKTLFRSIPSTFSKRLGQELLNFFNASVLKAIIVLCLYVAAYWYGLGFICVPLISRVFNLFGWNKNLAFAISSFLWLGVVGLLGLKLGETEFGMWLMDI